MANQMLRDSRGRWAGSTGGVTAPTSARHAAQSPLVHAGSGEAGAPSISDTYSAFRERCKAPWLQGAPPKMLSASEVTKDYAMFHDHSLEEDDYVVGDRERRVWVRKDSAELMFRSEPAGISAEGERVYMFPGYRLEDGSHVGVADSGSGFRPGVVRTDGSFDGSVEVFQGAVSERLGEDGCPLADEDFGIVESWDSEVVSTVAGPRLHIRAESEPRVLD